MKKSQIKTKFYNLIEVTLAMGVVALGMTAVLSLFSIGINKSNDLKAATISTSSVEEFIAYIQFYSAKLDAGVANNYNSLFSGSSSLFKTAADINYGSSSFNDTIDILQDEGTLNKVNSLALYYKTYPDLGRVFFAYRNQKDKKYPIMILAWKSPVTTRFSQGGTWTSETDTTYSRSAGLCVEVSWPLSSPYSERKKQYFYTEIKKPS